MSGPAGNPLAQLLAGGPAPAPAKRVSPLAGFPASAPVARSNPLGDLLEADPEPAPRPAFPKPIAPKPNPLGALLDTVPAVPKVAKQPAPRQSAPAPDYDYEGARKAGLAGDGPKGHWPDTYKLPNHITFSTDSKYSNPKTPGGTWREVNGKWHYKPSTYVISQHGEENLRRYFAENERDAVLELAPAKPAVAPKNPAAKTDAQLKAEAAAKLETGAQGYGPAAWTTHYRTDPQGPSLGEFGHNLLAPFAYGGKLFGEAYNTVNRSLGILNAEAGNPAGHMAKALDPGPIEPDVFYGDSAIPPSVNVRAAEQLGMKPAFRNTPAPPPVDPRVQRAEALAYQEHYGDPRASETVFQQGARHLLGDLADPRVPTVGEAVAEHTGRNPLGMLIDGLVPVGPLSVASKLTKGVGKAAEFLVGQGTKLTRAEAVAQVLEDARRGEEIARRTQQANASARAGLGRLAETERVQGIRRAMAPFEVPPPAPGSPRLHIPEAAAAPPKLHSPEAAANPLAQLLEGAPAPKLYIPEAAANPVGDVLEAPTARAVSEAPLEAARPLPADYLATLKPTKQARRKAPKAVGQGDVFQGPATTPAPVNPLAQLLEAPAVPPRSPWQPPEMPGPIKPELEYRPGQVDTPRPRSPFRAPEAPASPAVPYAPDPAAPIDPAARMGQVFKAAARRIGFTPEKIARPYGAYLTVGDVEKVFAGTATPEQVKLVTNAIGMEFSPQGFRWTPPRGAKNVSGWNEQLELARAWEIAPPPDRMKSAPMQAGNRAMVANRPPAPKPATFWDDSTRPGDLQAGPRSETFMPQELKVDAKAYQFKEGGDAVGVTDALRGVRTWDRSKSGKALVHERLDGNYYIADGHQRLGLATRLTREGQPAALDTLVYREADGYSVADVRRIAAAKNLAEGTGSAIDAAKVAREAGIDHPDLTSIPKSKPIYRDGEQLAKLGDRAFEEVVNGAVKTEYAAHVGRLIQGDAAQLAALKALRRLKPGSSPEALSIVQDIRAQGLASKTEQGGLFGAEETMEDLLGERARIFSAAQSIAATDKSLFRQIVRGEGRFAEAGNVLAGEVNRAQITDAERLLAGLEEAKYRGPVAARLNQLAREVKAGSISEQKAARAFLDSVRSESEVAHAARPGAGRPALGPDYGRVGLEGVREQVPDIEGQDTFFSMEQGGRLPRRNQGALFPPERQATPKFPEAPKVKGAGQGRLIPEAPKDLNAPKVGERIPAPYDFAGQKVQLGKMEVSRRLPMPALVKLSRSITGQVPDVSKALQSLSKRMGARVNGRFSGGRVEINPDLFANEDMASKVLGHEIGHVIDLIGPQKGQVQAFRSALAAEMRKAPELYREALRLSREWRPYTQAGADARFLKYREAAEEVIADFLSAFLNDAAYAQKTAPQLTQAFFSTLSSRPKVQKALLEVYDMMDGTLADFHGAVAREVDTSFMKAEDLWKAIADERKAREGSFWQRVVDETRYMFSDVGGEAKRRAQRAEDTGGLKGAYDPRVMFDEYGMSGNRTFLMARDWQDGVVAPLREAGLAEAEFGRYLFARRIAQGDRAAQANPLGVTARNAEAILAEMKGKPGFDALEKAGRKARKLYGQALKDAYEAGAVSREDYQAAKAGAETWADFRLVDDLHKRVSADLKGPGGTFEDVANPATATFMKAAALRNVAEANRARAGMVEFMRSNYANEIRVAKKNELPKFGEASFEVLEDGKKVTYIADRWLADTFDGERFDRLGALARLVTAFDQKFKGLWITFNLGFQMMNVLRDAQRTTRSLSALGVTSRWDPTNILRTFHSYGKTLPDAWQYAKGEVTPLLREMIRDYAIAPPGESVTDILAGESKLEQEMMRTGGLVAKPEPFQKGLKPAWNRPVDTALDWALNARRQQRQGLGRLRIPLDNTLNFIREIGGTLEAVPKIAGYQRLGAAGQRGAQRAANVRDFVGTPNFKVRGAATNITNAAFTFSNIAIQGWKADLRLATGARTRGAFWLETLKQGLLPKLLMVGGAYGVFGGELQEMFDAISEYDKTQFLCLPFGWEEGGEHGKRVRYLRLPFDETTRFFAGLTWKALNGPRSAKDREDVLSDIFGFAWGQVPGLGPTATMGRELVQVAAGKNPEDEFRGRPKINKTEFEAGGAARWGGYLKASLGNFGMVGEVIRDGLATGSRPSYRLTAAGLPGLNRFFRVSDRGFTEIQQQAQHNKDKAKAQLKLGYGDKTKEVFGAYFRLQKLGRTRTRRQEDAFHRARQFYTGHYRHAQERVQRLLDDGHELEAERIQRELEKRAEPYFRDLNRLGGRVER